jgi:hypothetical protein
MPKLLRSSLPPEVLSHIYRRVMERHISKDALGQVLYWVDSDPTVPAGEWFKRFDGVSLAGRGALILTVLEADMVAVGKEVE